MQHEQAGATTGEVTPVVAPVDDAPSVTDLISLAASDAQTDTNSGAAVAAIDAARVENATAQQTTTRRRRGRPSNTERLAAGTAATAPLTGEVKALVAPAPKTKGEALKRVAELEAQLQQANAEKQAIAARGDSEAIKQLGATISMAVSIGSQFVAAARGSHWEIPEKDAKPVGEAWAIVAAPYASQIEQKLPWAMAILMTWQVIAPRLAVDKQIADERNRAKEGSESATPERSSTSTRRPAGSGGSTRAPKEPDLDASAR